MILGLWENQERFVRCPRCGVTFSQMPRTRFAHCPNCNTQDPPHALVFKAMQTTSTVPEEMSPMTAG